MSPPTEEQCEQARQVLLERAKAEVFQCSVVTPRRFRVVLLSPGRRQG
jgi:hypothetical protein